MVPHTEVISRNSDVRMANVKYWLICFKLLSYHSRLVRVINLGHDLYRDQFFGMTSVVECRTRRRCAVRNHRRDIALYGTTNRNRLFVICLRDRTLFI